MVRSGLNVRRFCRVLLRVGGAARLLPVIVGVFFAATCGTALAAAKGAKTPHVTWTPGQVNYKIGDGQGASWPVVVSFVSASQLENVTISVPPGLVGYVQPIPESITSVPANTPTNVTLTFEMPFGSPQGNREGKLQIKTGTKPVSGTLPISLGVHFGKNVVAKTTKVLTSLAQQSISAQSVITSFSQDPKTRRSKISFSKITSEVTALKLQHNDVLVVAPSPNLPHGFIGRVTSITQSGNQLTISYGPAALNDAFRTLSMSVAPSTTPIPGACANSGNVQLANFDQTFDHEFSAGPGDVQFSVEPSFNADLNFGLQANLLQGVTCFDSIITTMAGAKAEISANIGYDLSPQSADIATIPFCSCLDFTCPIVYPAGVPTCIEPQVAVSVDVDGMVSAATSVSADMQATYEAGVSCPTGLNSCGGIGQLTQMFTAHPPDTSVSGTLTGTINPEIQVLIDGVVGPYVNPAPYAEFDVMYDLAEYYLLDWQLILGINVGVGIAGEIGPESFEVGPLPVISYHTLVATGVITLPTPTVTVTPTPIGQTPTVTVTPTLTVTATPIGRTPTVTVTPTPIGQTPTVTVTPTLTVTATPIGRTPTVTVTPTPIGQTPTVTVTPTATPAWPMFQHDLRHTGLSQFDTSANIGAMKWSSPFPNGAPCSPNTGNCDNAAPVIGADGTIYSNNVGGTLYAINADGTQKWQFGGSSGPSYASPAIGPDGTIYTSEGAYLFALNRDGSTKWPNPYFVPTGYVISSSPTVGVDGTIYFGSADDNLYAINSDGTEKWKFTTGGYIKSSPAIGAGGTIYVGSLDGNLYAINSSGTRKWSFPIGGTGGAHEVESSPAIGADGTIYFGGDDNYIYALSDFGQGTVAQKWKFASNSYVNSSPAIGPDGTIYIGSTGPAAGHLYALNPDDGTQQWNKTGIFSLGGIQSSPVIGSDGTIYVGSNGLWAINADSTTKWTVGICVMSDCNPAIGPDGTIYAGSDYENLYAVGSGLISSPTATPTAIPTPGGSSPNPYIGPIAVSVSGLQATIGFQSLTPTTNGYAQDVSITSESVNWDDGTTSVPPNGDVIVSHNYPIAGTYNVTVAVGNSIGGSSSESTTVTVTAPTTLPTWSCLGVEGQPQSVCNVLGNPGYAPYPLGPDWNFFASGTAGWQITGIFSDGPDLRYGILYGIYVSNGLYFTPSLNVEFPVSYSDPTEVGNCMSFNNASLQALLAQWSGNVLYSTVNNNFTPEVNSVNSYIQNQQTSDIEPSRGPISVK